MSVEIVEMFKILQVIDRLDVFDWPRTDTDESDTGQKVLAVLFLDPNPIMSAIEIAIDCVVS